MKFRIVAQFDDELKGWAIKWTGQNLGAVTDFLGYMDKDEDGKIVVLTPAGSMSIDEGDWLVKLDDAGDDAAPAVNALFWMLFRELDE